MGTYVVKRVLQIIPVLIGITFLAFLVFYFGPGDPVLMILGEHASPELIERERTRLGLDQPMLVQYARFLGNLAQGDLGISYRSREPVTSVIAPALRATVILAIVTMLFTALIGIPTGILAATNRGGVVDQVTMSVTMVGVSAPAFFVGILLLLVFSYQLRWFPASGMRDWNSVVLPALTIALHFGAMLARMTRSAMLEVLGEDYIRTAKSKGLARRVVEYKHALRNAALPVVTLLGLQAGHVLGGAVVAETIFAWPGLGRLLLNGIIWRDAPLVQAGVIIIAFMFSVVTFFVDIVYSWLNPTIRYG